MAKRARRRKVARRVFYVGKGPNNKWIKIRVYGPTNLKYDVKRRARPAGWRTSRKSKRRYYEARRNRSDNRGYLW